MEEKEKEVKKLSYEQLEGAAKQLSAQLDAVVKENQQLKAFASQAFRGPIKTISHGA